MASKERAPWRRDGGLASVSVSTLGTLPFSAVSAEQTDYRKYGISFLIWCFTHFLGDRVGGCLYQSE